VLLHIFVKLKYSLYILLLNTTDPGF